MADLAQQRLLVTEDQHAKSTLLALNHQLLPDMALNLRIQRFIMDPHGMQELRHKDELQDGLHILLRIELTPVHLMLSKKSTTETQLQQINLAIEQLKQSPDYQQILDRYQFGSRHP